MEIKPQSDALKRILGLQSGYKKIEFGKIIPTICPKI